MTYLESLQEAIRKLHGCESVHVESVAIDERFQGKPVWQGTVEVFDLTGHPKAKRCYAWSHLDGKGDSERRFVAVLGIPPVDSPRRAVQAAIVSEAKNNEQRR